MLPMTFGGRWGGTRVEGGRELGGVMLKGGEEIQLRLSSMHFSLCPDVGDTLFQVFAASIDERSAGTGVPLHPRMEGRRGGGEVDGNYRRGCM